MYFKRLPGKYRNGPELQILVLQPMISSVLFAAARNESLYGVGKPSRIKVLK